MLKGDIIWDDVHVLAHKIAIDGLLSLGILKGDKDEILKARTSAAFLPHGLGHHLGMDTHDTGGNPNYEDKDKLFRYLRIRGKVPAGSVVTVEPGVSRPLAIPCKSLTRIDLLLRIHHQAVSGGPRAQQVYRLQRVGQVLGCWRCAVSGIRRTLKDPTNI